MKKAKLMLAGIACLAVVGGAFAVKANKFGPAPLYLKTSPAGACNVTTFAYKTAAIGTVLNISTAPTTATSCPRTVTLQ